MAKCHKYKKRKKVKRHKESQGLYDLFTLYESWHESISKTDYPPNCHILFSLKQCDINMFIQREGTIDPVRLGDVSGKNNVFDIFIKLHIVSQRKKVT